MQTPNSKIFKSTESYPSEDILNKATNDLLECIDSNEVPTIRDIFEKLIEGFKEGTRKL